MKKIAISLIALAALSTASFASYRDITTPYGAVDTKQQAATVVTMDAMAIHSSSNGKAGDDLELGGSNRN
jgi:hypothetical protein